MTILTGQQVADEGLIGWVYVPTLLGGLHTRIRTPDFATGLKIVTAIGAAAVAQGHAPSVDLRADHVDVRVCSTDDRAVTQREVQLARTITTIAVEADIRLDPTRISGLELALDSPNPSTLAPFWRAVLGVDDRGDDSDVLDQDEALPTVWFQPSGRAEPRQRWHPDVWVDPAQVQPRINAALAAGGTLVYDAEAPAFWTLADPEGNRICLCTWQGRG